MLLQTISMGIKTIQQCRAFSIALAVTVLPWMREKERNRTVGHTRNISNYTTCGPALK